MSLQDLQLKTDGIDAEIVRLLNNPALFLVDPKENNFAAYR